MKNHSKLWVILSLLIVFAAGVVTGILAEKHILQKKPRPRSSAHFPSLEVMSRELDLSPEQQQRIKEFFLKSDEEFKSLRSHMRERLTSMRFQLIASIKSALNGEQAAKFEAMLENYLSQRKKERERIKEPAHKSGRNKDNKGGRK